MLVSLSLGNAINRKYSVWSSVDGSLARQSGDYDNNENWFQKKNLVRCTCFWLPDAFCLYRGFVAADLVVSGVKGVDAWRELLAMEEDFIFSVIHAMIVPAVWVLLTGSFDQRVNILFFFQNKSYVCSFKYRERMTPILMCLGGSRFLKKKFHITKLLHLLCLFQPNLNRLFVFKMIKVHYFHNRKTCCILTKIILKNKLKKAEIHNFKVYFQYYPV